MVFGFSPQNPAVIVHGVPAVVATERWAWTGHWTVARSNIPSLGTVKAHWFSENRPTRQSTKPSRKMWDVALSKAPINLPKLATQPPNHLDKLLEPLRSLPVPSDSESDCSSGKCNSLMVRRQFWMFDSRSIWCFRRVSQGKFPSPPSRDSKEVPAETRGGLENCGAIQRGFQEYHGLNSSQFAGKRLRGVWKTPVHPQGIF